MGHEGDCMKVEKDLGGFSRSFSEEPWRRLSLIPSAPSLGGLQGNSI